MTIAENIAAVQARIDAAAQRAGRDPRGVHLIGAAKSMSIETIDAAVEAGLREIGENFVQEAALHHEANAASHPDVRWHLIGHLQTNKVPVALNLFDILQSVDSLRLAEQIDRKASSRIQVLLEVNIGAEPSKFGFAPDEVAAALISLQRLTSIEAIGLMTIAPAVPDAEQVRPLFRELRELAQAHGLAELSMGMTDDFEVAIEEGATMVRIGRAIFGERR